MLKVYIPDFIPGVRLAPFISGTQGGGRLFQNINPKAFQSIFERTASIDTAELIIVPHEFASLKQHQSYIQSCLTQAHRRHKPILFSAYQDDPKPLTLPREVFVLRSSAFRKSLHTRDIVIPAYVEDLGANNGSLPLSKGELPTVGFAGKAGFANAREAIRYTIRNYIVRRGAEKQGLFFRRKALQLLSQDTRITLNAIVRKKFSAHRNTIELSPAQARREYIESIKSSLFTLSPRGDGNFSLRFYETLSLGRLPILIDTDMPLPLEDIISYDDFILRIPWNELGTLPDRLVDFFNKHTDEDLRTMQHRAREIFEKYLFMPTFLRTILTRKRFNISS